MEYLGLEKNNFDPIPEKRTDEYYKKRPCSELVAFAAKMTQEFINSN